MAALSYTYRTSTGNVIWTNGANLILPWPQADIDAANVDTANAQVVVGSNILAPAQYTLAWSTGAKTITITNSTGADIPPQTDVVVVAPALAGALTQADADDLKRLASGAIPPKGGQWKDLDDPDPNIYRLRDRVFVGNAVLFSDNRQSSNNTWVPEAINGANWIPRDSTMCVMQERGSIALSGMSRCSDGDAMAPGVACIGVAGATINDTTVVGKVAWSLYSDVQHAPNASVANQAASYGLELALKNRGSSISPTPYGLGYGVHGIWLQTGGDVAYGGASDNPITCGISFRKGGNTANMGICFGADAIAGTDGVTGAGIAIGMARGHIIRWYYAGGATGASIRSDVDASGQAVSVAFGNNVIQFLNNGNARTFQLTAVASGANFINVTQAIAGAPAIIAAAGTDTDIHIRLDSKGANALQLGNASMFAANGSVACTMTSLGPTGARTTIQKWMKIYDNAGNPFYSPLY